MQKHPHWLNQCSEQLQYLERTLATSLGPCGRHKLVVTSTKQVVCTSSGSTVLASLKVDHPLLMAAVKAAQSFGEQHGDGSKRFLLMVLAGLRTAAQHLPSTPSPAPPVASLCQELSKVQAYHHGMAQDVLNRLSGNCQQTLTATNPTSLRSILRALVVTHMANHASDQVVRQILSTLILDLILVRLHAKELTCRALESSHSGSESQAKAKEPDASSAAERDSVASSPALPTPQSSSSGTQNLLSAPSQHIPGPQPPLPPTPPPTQLPRPPPISQATPPAMRPCTPPPVQPLTSPTLLPSVLSELARDPPVHILPGQPREASCLLPGLLLDQPLVTTRPPTRLNHVRLVVLAAAPTQGTCIHHHKPSSTDSASVLVTSPAAYIDALGHDTRQWYAALQVLHRCGVNLLLCTHSFPDSCVQLATEAGVALMGSLSTQQAKAVCDALNITPLTCVTSLLTLDGDELVSDHVGSCDEAVERAVVGPAGAVRHNRGCLLTVGPQAASLVLCAPSHGVCVQYHKAVAAALRALAATCNARQPALCKRPGAASTTCTDQTSTTDDPTTRSQHCSRGEQLGCEQAHASSKYQAKPCAQHVHCLSVVPGGMVFEACMTRKLTAWHELTHKHRTADTHAHGGICAQQNQLCSSVCYCTSPTQNALHTEPCSGSVVQCSKHAYDILCAMACTGPQAMASTLLDGGARAVGAGQAHNPTSQLLKVFLAPSVHHSGSATTSALGLVHPPLSPVPCGNFLRRPCPAVPTPSTSIGAQCHNHQCHNAQRDTGQCGNDQCDHDLVLADPVEYGLLEPAALHLALWQAATQTVLQLLRVDGVVSVSRRSGAVLGVKPGGGCGVRRKASRLRRGGDFRDPSDSDGSGGGGGGGGARWDSTDDSSDDE